MKAGVESPPGSERIAAADELKLHRRVPYSRSFTDGTVCQARGESI